MIKYSRLNKRQFLMITLITSIWIHISEVFRYFVLIRPRVKSYFEDSTHIADMNLSIFAIWGAWDILLTAVLVFICWLFVQVFDHKLSSIVSSGTLVWIASFLILWIGIANMGLSSWSILWIALPLSWMEMVIGAYIATKMISKR